MWVLFFFYQNSQVKEFVLTLPSTCTYICTINLSNNFSDVIYMDEIEIEMYTHRNGVPKKAINFTYNI